MALFLDLEEAPGGRSLFTFDPLAAGLVHPVEQGPGLFAPLRGSGDSSRQKLEGLIVTAQILQKTGFESSNSRGDSSRGYRKLERDLAKGVAGARMREYVEPIVLLWRRRMGASMARSSAS